MKKRNEEYETARCSPRRCGFVAHFFPQKEKRATKTARNLTHNELSYYSFFSIYLFRFDTP